MQEAMSTHPEPYRHDFPKGDVFTGWSYPPTDYDKWGKLVETYATHLKQRYGAATDGWLWEVWNEPDIPYWHGTPEEYDRLYDVTTAAIRKVLPEAKVGGPGATGINPGKSEAFFKQFWSTASRGRMRWAAWVLPWTSSAITPRGRRDLSPVRDQPAMWR